MCSDSLRRNLNEDAGEAFQAVGSVSAKALCVVHLRNQQKAGGTGGELT